MFRARYLEDISCGMVQLLHLNVPQCVQEPMQLGHSLGLPALLAAMNVPSDVLDNLTERFSIENDSIEWVDVQDHFLRTELEWLPNYLVLPCAKHSSRCSDLSSSVCRAENYTSHTSPTESAVGETGKRIVSATSLALTSSSSAYRASLLVLSTCSFNSTC